MKMKSAVLASALVAVSSVFADIYTNGDIYNSWFTAGSGTATPIDTDLDSPTIVNGNTSATASDGYAVTAQVTVVIHAALPQPDALILTDGINTFNPKGSICAAYDNGVAKWFGLKKENDTYSWVALAGMDMPTEASHTLVTEFDDKGVGVHNVRYWVDGVSSGWLTSGHKNALTKVGLAGGTGSSYTKVVGLLVNAWSATIDSVPISIDKAMLAAMGVSTANTTPEAIVAALKTPQDNGIAKWANYALGIDGTNEDNKPFAAPVQNGSANTLTFKLGGVNPTAGTGATVTYGVAAVDSPSATAEPSNYVDPSSAITLDVPDTVKYYRVKVKIDQAN